MRNRLIGWGLSVFTVFNSGCGMKAADSLVHDATKSSTQSASIAELSIKPEDWLIKSEQKEGTDVSIRTLKLEKLEFIKKNFHAPSLSAITVPESNGFELYELKGYKELEESVYIHPKLYLNTSTPQGSIMGYKTGVTDDKGNELVEISVPVALVNGLVPAVGVIGSSTSDEEPIVKLPAHYLIPDSAALKTRVGKSVHTLPVCPELFRLTFENREYWAKSPFEGLSTCPLNQFFRIRFQAPANEMNRILETASTKESAVNIVTNLAVTIDVPKLIVELQVGSEKFLDVLKSKLAQSNIDKEKTNKSGTILLSEVEEIVNDSLFELSKRAGLNARASSDILAQTRKLILKYFNRPSSCGQQGVCTSLRAKPLQSEPVKFSWQDSELLVATLHTEAVTALGAVANSNWFTAKPTRNQLEYVRKPEYFKSSNIDSIAPICAELAALGWPEKYLESAVNYGTTAEDREYFKEYCKQIVGNSSKKDSDPEQNDGYYPFITSTTVYPGAWIKIDLKNIEELTTAKTRRDSDGNYVVESQVVDLLSSDPSKMSGLSVCTQGAETACAEYEKEVVPTRDEHGDQILGDISCSYGEKGCSCSTSSENGKLICVKKVPLTHETLKYDCSNGVETTYCPYWKTKKDEIVGYDISYECQDEKIASKTSFLCVSGCTEQHQMTCKEKERKAVKADRDYLMCKGYEGGGDIPPEKTCSNPRFRCLVWNKKCTKYSVNEAFHIVHEDIVPKWRPYNISAGEYPQRFEDDIYLKFVSPGSVVSNCRLSQFEREIRGNSLYIKLPSKENEGNKMCDGKPIWNEINTKPNHLPKVYLKNSISFPVQRKCGKTEYSFLTKELPRQDSTGLVPKDFSYKTEVHVGPIRETCRATSSFQVGDDLWFSEYPPIRFSGRVSVLGKGIREYCDGE